MTAQQTPLIQRRIEGLERVVFGGIRTSCNNALEERLQSVENVFGLIQQEDVEIGVLERLDAIERLVRHKKEQLEEHELDYFGEYQQGGLTERWRRLLACEDM